MKRLLTGALLTTLLLRGVASAIIFGTPAPSVTVPAAHDLRSGLTVIHAFVEKKRKPFGRYLENLKVPSLTDAAEQIKKSTDDTALAGRMLATVRLVAHARDDREASRAVDVLIGANDHAQLLSLIASHRADGCTDGIDPIEERKDLAAEKEVADGLQRLYGTDKSAVVSSGACTHFYPYSYVGAPKDTNDVVMKNYAHVGRKFDDAQVKIDPQNWDSCPTIWKQACIVDKGVCDGTLQFEGEPQCLTNPPVAGKSYLEHCFYEKVECPDGKCEQRVLLGVQGTLTADQHTVQYSYKKWLGGSVELVGDNGTIVTKKSGNDVTVEADKRLGFTETSKADMVYLLLQNIDIASYLSMLICCP